MEQGCQEDGTFLTCHQEILEGRCSPEAASRWDFSNLPPGDAGREMLPGSCLNSLPGLQPPQHSEGPRSILVPDCASPCGWESPEGGGKQKGRALKGAAVHQLLWLPCTWVPRLPPSLSPTGFLLPASRATTMKRRASDSESSVYRTRSQTAGGNVLSPLSQVASGRGAGDSCCLLGPESGLGSVPA